MSKVAKLHRGFGLPTMFVLMLFSGCVSDDSEANILSTSTTDQAPLPALEELTIPFHAQLTGTSHPSSNGWRPLSDPQGLVLATKNCLFLGNLSAAGIESIEISAGEAAGIGEVQEWQLGFLFWFTDVFWQIIGPLPLSVGNSSLQTAIQIDGESEILVYLLPADPTPNVAIKQEVDLKIVIWAQTPSELVYDVERRTSCG